MAGNNPLIDQLAEASRVVHRALASFDAITGRINGEDIAAARAEMAADGEPNADERADTFAQERMDATARERSRLHRMLWLDLALGKIVSADALFRHFGAEVLPGGILEDLIASDRIVWAGCRAAGEIIDTVRAEREQLLQERRALLMKAGVSAEEVDAHIERRRAGGEAEGGEVRLRRQLWEAALPHIIVKQEA